jgi:hypothetical protein
MNARYNGKQQQDIVAVWIAAVGGSAGARESLLQRIMPGRATERVAPRIKLVRQTIRPRRVTRTAA